MNRQLLADNEKALRNGFPWETAILRRACCVILTGKGRRADIESIRNCKKTVNRSTGAFSAFRGNMRFVLAVYMSLQQNPYEFLQAVFAGYRALRILHMSRSDFTVIAAITIALSGEETEELAARTADVYAAMRKEHPFLIGREDTASAALMALRNADLDRMEDIYRRLKGTTGRNAVQAAAQILTLGDPDSCRRFEDLWQELRQIGLKPPCDAVPGVACLALTQKAPQELSAQVAEAYDILKHLKSFRWAGKPERLADACALISAEELRSTADAVLAANAAVILLAQQAAIIAGAAAAGAAASASSSS